MVRHDLAVYSSPGGDFLTYLPSFSGVTVIGSTSSWYEIRYNHSSGTRYGWATKEDFTYDCLIYDGRKKQPLADGVYRFRDQSLAQIAARLQNYYGVLILLIDEAAEKIRYTGSFSLTERLDEVFGVLNHDGRLHIERDGNTYRIRLR